MHALTAECRGNYGGVPTARGAHGRAPLRAHQDATGPAPTRCMLARAPEGRATALHRAACAQINGPTRRREDAKTRKHLAHPRIFASAHPHIHECSRSSPVPGERRDTALSAACPPAPRRDARRRHLRASSPRCRARLRRACGHTGHTPPFGLVAAALHRSTAPPLQYPGTK